MPGHGQLFKIASESKDWLTGLSMLDGKQRRRTQ